MARGSVIRWHDGYAIRYDLAPEDDGNRRQKFVSGFRTHADAKEALAKAIASVVLGTHQVVRKETLKTFAEHWLLAREVRPASTLHYRIELDRYIIPQLGTLRLQEIRTGHVVAALTAWRKTGLGARQVRALHQRLRSILALAVHEHILAVNVAADVALPRAPHTEMQVWTPAQLAAFLAGIGTGGLAPLWHVYALTGLRRGEALGLQWSDLDLAAGTLAVRRQSVRSTGSVRLDALKTANSRRTLSIDATTIEVLGRQKAAVTALRMAFRQTWQDHNLVFPYVPERRDRLGRRPGTPQCGEHISELWQPLLARLPLPPIRLHDLRHTHATHLLQAGTPVHVVANRLGHDPATLLRTYAHVLDAQQQAVASWLEVAYKQA